MKSLTGIICVGVLLAQTPAPTEFEVASVRENLLNDRIVTIDIGPGGRFAVRGYTLVLLIQQAYGVMDWNVTLGPSWIRSDRFDIVAKAVMDGNLTARELRPMLQKLLADRFKLRLHESSKEMPGYALVVAKGGPKLKPSADGQEHSLTFRLNQTGLSGQGIPMRDFARYVAGKLGLVAVDKTGLTGAYDVNAEWKEDASQYTGGVSIDPKEALQAAVFRAIEDQLGLKMVQQKIAVQMLVIDSVEKPSEN